MSSTDTLERPRPFDRLPNELLAKMLLDLPPPTISLEDDPPRVQNALFALSLVSRRFRTFSCDLLWQGSTIRAASTEKCLLRAISVVAHWPAIAQLGPELDLLGRGTRPLRDWTVLLPGADRLVARSFDRLDLVDLARFRNLRHLSVNFSGIDLSPTTVLPHLESMRLSVVEFTGARSGASILGLPVLRHLAFTTTGASNAFLGEVVFGNAFLARLDSLEVSSRHWLNRRRDKLISFDDPLSSLPPILWRVLVYLGDNLHSNDNTLSTTSVPYAEHLLLELSEYSERVGPASVHWERSYVELRRLIALHKHPRLRLVLVSGAPWRRTEATLPELAAIEALEEYCEWRGLVLRTCEAPRVERGPVPELLAFLREEAARVRS